MAVMKKVNSSNRSGFEALLRVYRETDLSQEKGRVLGSQISPTLHKNIRLHQCSHSDSFSLSLKCTGSLTSSPDPDIVLEALNFLLSSEVSVHVTGSGLFNVSV